MSLALSVQEALKGKELSANQIVEAVVKERPWYRHSERCIKVALANLVTGGQYGNTRYPKIVEKRQILCECCGHKTWRYHLIGRIARHD